MIRSTFRRMTFGRWPSVREGEALSCPEVGRLLQTYLDDEIEHADEASALAAHLEECKRCGLEADTYRKIKDALADRRTPVPEEAVERLRTFGQQLTS